MVLLFSPPASPVPGSSCIVRLYPIESDIVTISSSNRPCSSSSSSSSTTERGHQVMFLDPQRISGDKFIDLIPLILLSPQRSNNSSYFSSAEAIGESSTTFYWQAKWLWPLPIPNVLIVIVKQSQQHGEIITRNSATAICDRVGGRRRGRRASNFTIPIISQRGRQTDTFNTVSWRSRCANELWLL